MKTLKEENTLLASLAVFRELYNSKKDVYGTIASFLNEIIRVEALYSFTLNDITAKLNSTYEFTIPDAVVKTSLGRLSYLKKERTNYEVQDISKIKDDSLDEKQKQIKAHNNSIYEKLIQFVESKLARKLNDNEIQKLFHSFCNFIIEQSNGNTFLEFITAFIVENKGDAKFLQQLNLIREGVILYSGIKFNNNLNDLGTWKTELTIYLETEILFHFAGYNGELYQNLVLDLFELIREINSKPSKKLIKLKYFPEIKVEIEGFFTKARYLVEGNQRPNPNTTAMVSIVNGCKTPSDVVEKRSDFFLLLKENGIEEDESQDYFNPSNFHFNVINQEILDKVSKEIGEDAEPYLKFLNYISIIRKQANEANFENIGHILLTGNTTTLKVAWNELVKDSGYVPLATHLNFLTNKFWFKLNKGFGKGSLPKTFDVITKAQVVLSKVLNDSVGDKFEDLRVQFQEGKITEEQARARIIDLRNQVRKPEDIKSDVINDVLSVITEDSLDRFIQERSFLKVKAEKQEEENLKLQSELETKKDVEIKYIEAKEQILIEKNVLKDTLERQLVPIDNQVNKRYKNFKIFLWLLILVYYTAVISSIFYFKWEEMEQYTHIIGLTLGLIPVVYILVTEQSITLKQYLIGQKLRIQTKTYREFNFDITHLKNIKSEINDLENEVKSLKASR
jgi:hypothetical protein